MGCQRKHTTWVRVLLVYKLSTHTATARVNSQKDWGWVWVAFICLLIHLPFSAVFEFLHFKCLRGKHCTPQQWPSLTHPVSRQGWREECAQREGKTSVCLLGNSLKPWQRGWWWREDRWMEACLAPGLPNHLFMTSERPALLFLIA